MSKYLHALGALAAASISAAAASVAQVQAPVPALIQPSPRQMQDERDPLISPPLGQMSARQMLRALDQASPQQILIGEGVGEGARIKFGGQMRLSALLDVLCQSSNLTWGHLNRDTIVVLRARPSQLRFSQSVPLPAPRVLPRNPLDPRNPAPDLELRRRPDAVPENARPFNFNGQPYYLIPLRPELHAAPASPQPHDQPQR